MRHPSHCILCKSGPVALFHESGGRLYWRCPRCRLAFLDPAQRLSQAEERAHYRLHENSPDDPGYRAFLSRLMTPLLARIGPGASGLDYGAGPGPTLSVMLEERGHGMRCYDPAFCPDEAALSGRYDFITMSEVAEHLHDPSRVFDLLARLLRPNGLIAIMTGFLEDDIDFAGWHYRRDPTHVAFFCGQAFRTLARDRGWLYDSPERNIALLMIPDRPS